MAILRRSKARLAGATTQEPVQSIAIAEEARTKSNRTDPDAIILKYREKAVNRKSAIRAHCVECMGGYIGEIAHCTSESSCALWPFRMGENPFDQRTIKAREKGGDE